jgi:regulation of enolase protein 1 (concanavalin A-like superfamily)
MIFYPGSSSAQNAEQSISLKVKAIPYALQKLNNPLKIEIEDNSSITILADKNTNLFNSPGGNFYRQNAPMLLFQPDSNFILKAKVTAELKEVYDVAALVIYHDKDLWAKLCFENSANKESLVVSVVTRKYSDDCNSFRLSNN